jgi:exportin-T
LPPEFIHLLCVLLLLPCSGLISFAAMGFAINDEASQEANAAAEAALQLLDVLTPAIIQAFCSGVLVVAMPLVPFISAYVARLKALSKRNQALPANVGGHLQSILVGVVVNSVYPQDSFNDEGASSNMFAEESAAREEQQEVEERRKELFVLLKNVAKLVFSEALRFTGQLLQLVLDGSSNSSSGGAGSGGASGSQAAGLGTPAAANGTPVKAAAANGTPAVRWQDVEVAVTCVYELGEGAPEEALKPGSGDLGQLALLLMSRGAQLPCGQHRLVALATLEVTVRYCRVLQQQQSAIPPVLSLFVGWSALGHPAPDVCARACYLFSRLVKQLRSNLKQYVSEILQSVEPHLRTVATCPPTTSGGGGSAGGSGASPGGLVAASGVRDSSGKVLMPSTSMVDDRLYLFEAVSLLLGLEEINAEQQQAALSSLLQILMQQLEVNLQQAVADAAAAGDGGRTLPLLLPGGQPGAIWLVLQSVEALTRLNKGFKTDLVTKSRPHLGKAPREASCWMVKGVASLDCILQWCAATVMVTAASAWVAM